MSSHFQIPQSWSSDDAIGSVDALVTAWLKQQRWLYWPATTSEEDHGSSTNADQHRSKRRRRCLSAPTPKYKKMPRAANSDRDDASITSQSSAPSAPRPALRDRQILQPTPPSSLAAKRGRSSSPSKKIRQRLEHATPAIRFVAPSSSVDEPTSVREVKGSLMGAVEGYIPRGLQGHFQDSELVTIVPSNFDDRAPCSDKLWNKVHNIFKLAEQAQRRQKDENAWIEICRKVLRTAGLKDNNTTKLEVISVQTQVISPIYLSRDAKDASLNKRADLALAASRDHIEIASLLDKFETENPDFTLSHLVDAYTSGVPVLCGIEVKTSGGDGDEALTQLGIMSAAALAKHAELLLRNADMGRTSDCEVPPFLGWTVVGHRWDLYISWQAMGTGLDVAGGISVLGPWPVFTGSTVSHQDIFKLVKLIKTVVQWIEDKQLEWFKRVILGNVVVPQE
ncbi:hypothetical protein B0J14DRAFT_373878 [Halenospora varia]|nr:hypothetical protein B0J14DRAFT_373878 [Halenospora varia]